MKDYLERINNIMKELDGIYEIDKVIILNECLNIARHNHAIDMERRKNHEKNLCV